MSKLWHDQTGSVHILVIGLFSLMMSILFFIVSFNWMHQIASINQVKPALDHATRAAALDIDMEEAVQGRLVWDQVKGTESFFKYLKLNLELDSELQPLASSYLALGHPLTIRSLEYITAPSYPASISRSVTIHKDSSNETERDVKVTIYGPSILAVIEFQLKNLGQSETYSELIPSVSSVRLR